MMLVSGPLNGYHEMRHDTAIGILKSEGKTDILIAV